MRLEIHISPSQSLTQFQLCRNILSGLLPLWIGWGWIANSVISSGSNLKYNWSVSNLIKAFTYLVICLGEKKLTRDKRYQNKTDSATHSDNSRLCSWMTNSSLLNNYLNIQRAAQNLCVSPFVCTSLSDKDFCISGCAEIEKVMGERPDAF